MTEQFTEKFEVFVKGVQEIINLSHEQRGFTFEVDKVTVKKGRRYVKVIRGTSVYAFVDINDGNVYKPASWKAPAKHARGNIFNDDNGLDCCGAYGVAYLR